MFCYHIHVWWDIFESSFSIPKAVFLKLKIQLYSNIFLTYFMRRSNWTYWTQKNRRGLNHFQSRGCTMVYLWIFYCCKEIWSPNLCSRGENLPNHWDFGSVVPNVVLAETLEERSIEINYYYTKGMFGWM